LVVLWSGSSEVVVFAVAEAVVLLSRRQRSDRGLAAAGQLPAEIGVDEALDGVIDRGLAAAGRLPAVIGVGVVLVLVLSSSSVE
jgi:hypothetical protein